MKSRTIRLGGSLGYAISNSEGADARGPLAADQTAGILQPHSEQYMLGGALRAIANRGKNLTEAYEQTGDRKYFEENVNWLNKTLMPRGPDKRWDQNWMYGMASETLMDLYRQTGDVKYAQAAVNCCDSLINTYWKDDQAGVLPLVGFTVISFGYAYEATGNELYLKKGLLMLKLTAEEYAGSTKTFAQAFRISPYFLHYLTTGYEPPKPVVEQSNAKK